MKTRQQSSRGNSLDRKVLSLGVTPELLDALDAYAQHLSEEGFANVSRSAAVRELLVAGLRRWQLKNPHAL